MKKSKKVIAIITAFLILLCTFEVFIKNSTIKINAQSPSAGVSEIRQAFQEYVDSVRNDFIIEDAVNYINTNVSGADIADFPSGDSINRDYFIKFAEDGIHDNYSDDNDLYDLNIPGSDGYVAAVLTTVSGKKIGVTAKIIHKIQELDIDSVDVFDAANPTANSSFESTASGSNGCTVTKYTGSADKLVFVGNCDIDGNMRYYEGSTSSTLSKPAKAMVFTGEKVAIKKRAFRYASTSKTWGNLVAVQFKNGFDSIGQEAFASSVSGNIRALKYVHFGQTKLIGTRKPSIGDSAFLDCEKLEFCKLPEIVSIDSLAFSNTKIRYISYTGNSVSSGNQYFLNKSYIIDNNYENFAYSDTAVKNGVKRVILNKQRNEEASFTRAITLGLEAFDNYTFDKDICTEATVKQVFENSYNTKTIVTKYSTSTLSGSKEVIGEPILNNNPIIADFNGTFTKNDDGAYGILTVTNNDVEFKIVYGNNPNASITDIVIEDYELTPKFDEQIYEYTLTVPSYVDRLNISVEKLIKEVSVGKITGNKNFVRGKVNVVTIPVVTANGENVEYRISVTRSEGELSVEEKIKTAFDDCVATLGNNTTAQKLMSSISEKLGDEVKIADGDFYIKYAVEGAYDEDDNPKTRINIPGKDGAVAAIVTLNGKQYGFTSVIKHKTENLGKLVTAKLGDYADPNDASKRIINWIGNGSKNARYKVVLPENTSYINVDGLKFEGNAKPDNIVALVMLGHQESIPQYSIFSKLEALVMADSIKGASTSATFISVETLKYVHFSKGWNSLIQWGMFYGCNSLVNINIPSTVTGRIEDCAFQSTALREITIPNVYIQNNPFANPQGDAVNGRNITKINEQMPLLKAAATLTNNAQDVQFDSTKTAEALKKEIIGDVILKSGIKTDWQDYDFEIGDTILNEVLIISEGEKSIEIPYFRNLSNDTKLKELSVNGFEITPAFSPDVTDYSLDVVNSVKKLKLVMYLNDDRSAVGSIKNFDALNNLPEGKTAIEIPVKAQNGDISVYKINITRSSDFDPNDTADKRISDAIRTMKLEYGKGNSETVMEKLDTAVHDNDYSIEVNNFYTLDSIEGAMDKDGILVPAYNGYISADISLTNVKEPSNTKKYKLVAPVSGGYKMFSFKSVSKASDFEVSEDGKVLKAYYGDAEKVVLPDGVEQIDKYWMVAEPYTIKALILPKNLRETPPALGWGMTNLEVCYMGNLVSKFGGQEFQNCYKLRYVHLSEQSPSISYAMFEKNFALADLYVPTSVKIISTNSFIHSFIREVVIPANATEIWGDCFSWLSHNPDLFASNGGWGKIIEQSDSDYIKSVIKNDLSRNKVSVKILSSDIAYKGSPFITDVTGAWSPTEVFAPSKSTTDSFIKKIKPNVSYSKLDMSVNEVLARAKRALDNVFVCNDTTSSDILSGVKSAYCSSLISQDYVSFDDLNMIRATKASSGRVTGTLKIVTKDGNDYSLNLDRNFDFVPALIPVSESKEDLDDGENNYDEYENNDDAVLDDNSVYEDAEIGDYPNEEEQVTGHFEDVVKTKKIRKKVGVEVTDYTFIIVISSIIGAIALIGGFVLIRIIVKRRKRIKK